MVRAGRYKLHIYHAVPVHQPEPCYRLHDMAADPQELLDLSDDPAHQGVLHQLKDAFTQWLMAVELTQGGRGGQASPSPDQRIVNKLQ